MEFTYDLTKIGTTARKWGVALLGVLGQVVAMNVLPDKYQVWAAAVVAFATAVGVYAVPNKEG